MAEWKMRRDDTECVIGPVDTLKQWARDGSIIKDDYIWNPNLETWGYARDVVELNGIVGSVRGVSQTRHGCGAGALLMILGISVTVTIHPLIGVCLTLFGLIMLVVAIIQSKRR